MSAVKVISPEMIWPRVAVHMIVGDLLIAPRAQVTLFRSEPLNGCCAQMINGRSVEPNTDAPWLLRASGNIEPTYVASSTPAGLPVNSTMKFLATAAIA